MVEIIVAILFASIVFYVAEKDNEDGDLYKILHPEKKL